MLACLSVCGRQVLGALWVVFFLLAIATVLGLARTSADKVGRQGGGGRMVTRRRRSDVCIIWCAGRDEGTVWVV